MAEQDLVYFFNEHIYKKLNEVQGDVDISNLLELFNIQSPMKQVVKCTDLEKHFKLVFYYIMKFVCLKNNLNLQGSTTSNSIKLLLE